MARLELRQETGVMDEIVQIKIHGLPPLAPVTVDAYIAYYNTFYLGFGHFYANAEGTVNVTHEPSLGGSYSGHVPMGLFTSMEALPGKRTGGRLLVKGNAGEILKFTVSVWKGHKSRDELQKLHTPHTLFGTIVDPKDPAFNFFNTHHEDNFICSAPCHRTFLHPSIKRVVLKDIQASHDGVKLRGTLFIPPGSGPFPGVISLFGGVGGAPEYRAALIAKHGYCCLALGYMEYQDLKAKTIYDWTMSYFHHAIDWLLDRPEVYQE